MPTNGKKLPDLSSISLYFHVPFCTKKCHYCHFYVIPDKEAHKQQYLTALKKEWEIWQPSITSHKIASIYFGGGTPALIGPKAIADILSWIHAATPMDFSEVEITLEANPENVSLLLMKDYAEAGVNRVSLGIQTLDDPLLIKLGRVHSAPKAIESVYETYKAGIHNISVDLMYDLPHQTLALWESTLKQVADLPITHVSLYNLTLEPHTVFFKKKNDIIRNMPDEQTSLLMYEKAVDIFQKKDFKQYEISAFCRENAYSRHNTGYWTGRPFIGFGPSAFSYWEGKRFSNIANLNRYCMKLDHQESPTDFEEQLDPAAARRELLAIRLRLMEGVDLAAFQQQFGLLESETLAALKQLASQGLITKLENKIHLTRRGILVYDTIASEII